MGPVAVGGWGTLAWHQTDRAAIAGVQVRIVDDTKASVTPATVGGHCHCAHLFHVAGNGNLLCGPTVRDVHNDGLIRNGEV